MSILYVVPTPIGNLKDITLRAIEVLREASIILSEDTRVTRKLLSLLKINYVDKKFINYFDHNEKKRIPEVLQILNTGTDVALVCDAGTPVLNDPGYKLVREIIKGNLHKVQVLPGPTSITTALIASALPPDRFTYLGYFPRKPSERRKLFKSLRRSSEHLKSTYIAFETQHRILPLLKAMREVLKENASVVLCRELTKMHESMESGTPGELIDMIEKDKLNLKGEMVVVLTLSNIGY